MLDPDPSRLLQSDADQRRRAPSRPKAWTARILALALAAGLSTACARQAGTEPGAAQPVAATGEESGARPGTELVPAASPSSPTVVQYEDFRDPLIGFNRAMFAFNDATARYVVIPVSKGYKKLLPQAARASIGNFFLNLKTPIYAVNHLLQGKPRRAGADLARFGINTTIGLAGLFDPAANRFSIARARTGFDDTLAGYGAGYGVYLVLPFLGSSDLRSGAGDLADYFLNPVPYFTDNPETLAIQGFDYLQTFAPQAERYEQLRAETEDPYLFFRNLHLQGIQRDADYEAAE